MPCAKILSLFALLIKLTFKFKVIVATFSFMLSEKGFFYAYMNKSSYNKLLPKKGDRVVFKFKIEDLEKKNNIWI